MPTGRFRLLGPGGRNISAKVLSDALGLEAGAEADSELHAGLEVLCPSFSVWGTHGGPRSGTVGQGSGTSPDGLRVSHADGPPGYSRWSEGLTDVPAGCRAPPGRSGPAARAGTAW